MAPTNLVIDIGGTNTRLGLAHGADVDPATVRRYKNAAQEGLPAVIADYLAQTGAQPDAACAAGAGPVRDGVLRLTNLDWVVDRPLLRAATGASHCAILNDLQAQGHAVSTLPEHALICVRQSPPHSPQAAKLVVNVGTGMNVAPVYRLAGQTLVPPSEAGHVTLPARTPEETRFAATLQARFGIATVEEALSGRGLEAMYHHFSAQNRAAAEIMAALDTDPHAHATAKLFVSLFGRVSGDLALIHLPFGGVYLVGGVTLHMADLLAPLGFVDAFDDKGRFSEFMHQFGIYVVQDDLAALSGCAAHLVEVLAAA